MNKLMKKLNSKKSGKKGFTLMEMLIVVAIIAILVAIAIPTYTNALTKAKEATDLANVRAYYAETVMKHMLDDEVYPTTDIDEGETLTIDGVDYELQAGSATMNTSDTDENYFGITYTPSKTSHAATTVGKTAE